MRTCKDKKSSIIIYRITNGIEMLRNDPTKGCHISRKTCSHVLSAYDLPNLWVLRLGNGWRILYSLIGDGKNKITVVIIFFGDHKEYERCLRY
jgi:hypothetical protein